MVKVERRILNPKRVTLPVKMRSAIESGSMALRLYKFLLIKAEYL